MPEETVRWHRAHLASIKWAWVQLEHFGCGGDEYGCVHIKAHSVCRNRYHDRERVKGSHFCFHHNSSISENMKIKKMGWDGWWIDSTLIPLII